MSAYNQQPFMTLAALPATGAISLLALPSSDVCRVVVVGLPFPALLGSRSIPRDLNAVAGLLELGVFIHRLRERRTRAEGRTATVTVGRGDAMAH